MYYKQSAIEVIEDMKLDKAKIEAIPSPRRGEGLTRQQCSKSIKYFCESAHNFTYSLNLLQ